MPELKNTKILNDSVFRKKSISYEPHTVLKYNTHDNANPINQLLMVARIKTSLNKKIIFNEKAISKP